MLEEGEGKGDQNGSKEEGGFKRNTECRQPCAENMVAVETHGAGAFCGRVHLPGEPIQTGEGKADAEDPNASQQDDRQAAVPHESESGGNNNEQAKPTGLAGGSEDRVGDGRSEEPGGGLGGERGLDGSKAEVEAEDDCEQARDIRHEAEGQRDEQWGENKGQGREGGICLAQAETDEGALEEKGSGEGDEKDGSTGGGEVGAKEPNKE